MNKVILIGRTTKEIVATQTNSGIDIANFTLAVQRKFRNADGEFETDFINCVAWRKTAELVGKYVKKGDRLGVVGELQTRSYEAQDGTRRYITEVLVNEIEFLTSKNERQEPESKLEEIDDYSKDDLPF